jgi:hypothetical protein
MARFLRFSPSSRTVRYTLVAILAFGIGSASVATAGPIVSGFVNLIDGTNTAAINSTGELSITDAGTHTALGKLNFDASGNLKTAGSVQLPSAVGQPASSLVTLEAVNTITACLTGLDFTRTFPDGGNGGFGGNFRVPAGQVLVVTELDWQYVHPSGAAAAGHIETLRLFIQNLAQPFVQRRAFESTVVLSAVGEGGASTTATTGFAVSSAAQVCADVSPGPTTGGGGLQHLIVRGYLIRDQ